MDLDTETQEQTGDEDNDVAMQEDGERENAPRGHQPLTSVGAIQDRGRGDGKSPYTIHAAGHTAHVAAWPSSKERCESQQRGRERPTSTSRAWTPNC